MDGGPTITDDMSLDDLRFEVKRLTQKVQVLENDKMILQEESLIAQSVKTATNSEDNVTGKLKEELAASRNMVTMCSSKFQVVQTFLDLERKALADVKLEVNSNTSRIMKEMETKMNIFKDTVLARESTLQKRYQKVKHDLFKAKELAERYKVELNEVKNDRRVLQNNLDNVDAELTMEKNKLTTQFAAITSKIEMYQKEHAKEVKKLNETMIEKENERKQFEDELAKWKLTLKLRVEEKLAAEKKAEDLAARLALEQAALLDEKGTCHELRAENSRLLERLETLQSQQCKLLDTHDALQGDFKALLTREKSLRAELSGNTTDKGEMQRKLRGITEKVSTMEAEHAQEVGTLKEELQQKQRLLDSALEGREREGVRAENAGREVRRLEELLASSISGAAGVKADLERMKAEKDDLARRLAVSERKVSEVNETVDSLRSDRDDALNQSLRFQEDMRQLKVKLSDAETALLDLSRKKNEDDSVTAEVQRLRSELEASELKHEQQATEIRGLKNTVRRECEERTELMIEASELRDRVARLGRAQRGAGGGVHSSVQARQEFKQPESGAELEEPGMLRQLAGLSSAATTAASSNRRHDNNDDNWSKQRQAAQQNSGKLKRKSKYRP